MPDPRPEELADTECRKLLAGRHLGRLALVDARGPLGEVTDREDLARLRALPLYPWAPGERARYLWVAPASLTGRRMRIPDEPPFTWWG